MKKLAAVALLTLLAVPAFAATPQNDEQKTLYSIGAYQARQLDMFNFTPEEFAMVQQGFDDAAAGKRPTVSFQEYAKKVQELAQSRRAAAAKVAKPGSAN